MENPQKTQPLPLQSVWQRQQATQQRRVHHVDGECLQLRQRAQLRHLRIGQARHFETRRVLSGRAWNVRFPQRASDAQCQSLQMRKTRHSIKRGVK